VRDASEPYFVEVDSSLAGRTAGSSAIEKAEQLRPSGLERVRAALTGRATADHAWRVGAGGERAVARELARLPSDQWFVFHDIPIGSRGANVDHLVVGPPGVFSLNTKRLNGNVWVAERVFLVKGNRTDYLSKARQEGERVARLLTRAVGHAVDIRPMLVIVAERVTIKAQPPDVSVVSLQGVRRWLLTQSARLSAAEVISIAGKAHRPETWQ
jgi:hypothetical protein